MELSTGNFQAGIPVPTGTLWERRLAAEWGLLQELAAANPERLAGLAAAGGQVHATLCGVPAPSLCSAAGAESEIVSMHAFRIAYPRLFPAVPLELYLQTPVLHPNIHPITGFVCLWERHRVSHTGVAAVSQLERILNWQLWNAEAPHVMQPAALERAMDGKRHGLGAMALKKIPSVEEEAVMSPPAERRRRLL